MLMDNYKLNFSIENVKIPLLLFYNSLCLKSSTSYHQCTTTKYTETNTTA